MKKGLGGGGRGREGGGLKPPDSCHSACVVLDAGVSLPKQKPVDF